jgi:parallel beta-helix repeat protein
MTSNGSVATAHPCAPVFVKWFNGLKIALFALLLVPLSLDPAGARTIYVDAASAGGDGSSGAPLNSITVAAKKAKPGDTVLVRRGVYSGHVKIYANGRSGAPILFKAERGAVIDGSRVRVDTLVEIGGSHVVFEGFEVRNASRTGIGLWGTFNTTVRKNVVRGGQGAGIWVGHHGLRKSGNNLVEQNVVFDNCRMNLSRKRSSGWPIGIAISVSDGSVVRSNRVYENHGEGIGVLSSSHVQVHDNIVYDNYSVNVYLDNAPNSKVRANTIGSTGNKTFFRHKRPPEGVLIANEHTRHPMPSRGISVVGNTLIGVRDVSYGTYGRNTGLHSSVISPNKVVSARWMVPPGRLGS